MKVYVVGVPGVGKTSVIREAIKYIKYNVQVVSVGDIMEELLKDRGIKRDEIRKKLTIKEEEELQIKAFEIVKEKYSNKDIIIDSHFVIQTRYGFKSALIKKVAEIIRPEAIVAIISEPYEILLRRVSDKSRDREIEDLRIIEIQQNLTIYYSMLLMYEYDTLLKVIKNQNNLLDVAAREFAEFVNILFENRGP